MSTLEPDRRATSTTLTLTGTTAAMSGNEYAAIFTNTLGSATSSPATLGVNQTVPTVQSGPTAGAITFGTPLSGVPLTGGGVVVGSTAIPGTWAITSPAGSAVPSAGMVQATATFTPTDAVSYTTVTAQVTVQVNKATPSVFLLPHALTYGQTLGNTPLLATARGRDGALLAGGTVIIQNAKFKPNAGRVTETVSYVPGDSADYNIVTETITVTVNKAHPKLSATVKTRKPAGGKAMSVLLVGLQPGAKEQLVVQNSHGKTQTVVKFTARGSSATINIKLTGAHHRRLAKGNYRVVIVQSATSNTYAGSSSVRKFKIVK